MTAAATPVGKPFKLGSSINGSRNGLMVCQPMAASADSTTVRQPRPRRSSRPRQVHCERTTKAQGVSDQPLAHRADQQPRISSLLPLAYTLALSNTLTPAVERQPGKTLPASAWSILVPELHRAQRHRTEHHQRCRPKGPRILLIQNLQL
jgi:hypothetical protein